MNNRSEISINTLFAIIDSGVSYEQTRDTLNGNDTNAIESLIKRGKDYLKSQIKKEIKPGHSLQETTINSLIELNYDPNNLPSDESMRETVLKAARAFAKLKLLNK